MAWAYSAPVVVQNNQRIIEGSLIIDDKGGARAWLKTPHPIEDGLPEWTSFKAAKIEVGINANQYSQVAKKYKSHKGLHSRI